MASHVRRRDYPSSWTVLGKEYVWYDPLGPSETLDQVTGAVFKNRVYEGTLRKQIAMTDFQIEFQQSATIAEVELLGPRSALNALWPYGKYPCNQRFAVLTSWTMFDTNKLFAGSMSASVREGLLRHSRLRFDGVKPYIIGARVPKVLVVREVAILDNHFWYSVRRVVLQGSFCQPHCRMGWSKGWVSLGVTHAPRYKEWARDPSLFKIYLIAHRFPQTQPRIHVKNPGKYKAYRLKLFPKTHARGPHEYNARNDIPVVTRDNSSKKTEAIFLSAMTFLGCTA